MLQAVRNPLCCSRAEPQEVISKLLGGQVRPFVTACVLNELRSLGTDFAGLFWTGPPWHTYCLAYPQLSITVAAG